MQVSQSDWAYPSVMQIAMQEDHEPGKEHEMDDRLAEALATMNSNWEAMGRADFDDAEDAADRFENSFYRFIDEFRRFVNTLKPRPATLEQLLALDPCTEIMDRLPAPLLLNFETEAELIIDGLERIDEDKYD